jgi:hypothetical protein
MLQFVPLSMRVVAQSATTFEISLEWLVALAVDILLLTL